MSHLTVYLGLFLVSFVAATILPAQSEILLTKLLLDTHYKWWILITVASVGNVLGSTVNWILGRYISHFKDRKWFPVKPEKYGYYEKMYQKYGKWSLLLSWVPVIGDPLTVLAGALREPFHIFLILVSLAKVGRYLVVAAIASNWI
jgi:membrane protein YqaA with SNARE-associated domain